MRILISAVLLILAIACSSFEPVTCYGTYMPQLRYDDAVEVRKGNRYGDCFEIRGTVKQAVDGGYIVSDGPSTWDVYIRWEGKPKLAKGDFIMAVVAAPWSHLGSHSRRRQVRNESSPRFMGPEWN